MHTPPEIAGTSIVLVGNFNPVIFSPDWFLRMGIFSDADYGAAKVEVLHAEIGILEMDWLALKVEPQRFVAETMEEPYARLLDFVVRVFGDFLKHTPVRAVGVNYQCHFAIADFEAADRIGLELAPREPWGDFGMRTINRKGLSAEKRGGLRSITLEDRSAHDDRPEGYIQTTVEPSARLIPGVYLRVNDHYEITNDKPVGCGEVVDMLRKHFDESVTRSKGIADTIAGLA